VRGSGIIPICGGGMQWHPSKMALANEVDISGFLGIDVKKLLPDGSYKLMQLGFIDHIIKEVRLWCDASCHHHSSFPNRTTTCSSLNLHQLNSSKADAGDSICSSSRVKCHCGERIQEY